MSFQFPEVYGIRLYQLHYVLFHIYTSLRYIHVRTGPDPPPRARKGQATPDMTIINPLRR